VSRADLAYADELLGPGGPIRSWLGNGVDLDRHRPPSAAARARARERLGLSPDDRVLITVGRFTEEKGLDRVLATFSHLVRFDPRARLLAVGASLPGDRAVPISLATDLGIPDRHIHAPGWLEDVRPALHAADVYVILSRGEGRSTAAMEAAAAGLPIVAAWIPGIEEVVHDGHNGLLVDGEAPVQVAEAIGDLWTDAVRCGAYARASRALAEHAFDQADVDRRLLTAYAAWGEVRRDAAVRPRAGT
jgi:UDP-glucose:(heptosyl)LPS alpha-1,3-glucosyltransferase